MVRIAKVGPSAHSFDGYLKLGRLRKQRVDVLENESLGVSRERLLPRDGHKLLVFFLPEHFIEQLHDAGTARDGTFWAAAFAGFEGKTSKLGWNWGRAYIWLTMANGITHAAIMRETSQYRQKTGQNRGPPQAVRRGKGIANGEGEEGRRGPPRLSVRRMAGLAGD